jgi:hypothetical protein
LAEYLDGAYRVGMRRACRVVEIGRSTYYYRSVRDDRAIRERIHEIAETRGYDTGINASMYYLSVRAGMLIIRMCTEYTVKTGLI